MLLALSLLASLADARADVAARSPLEVHARVLSLHEDAIVLQADFPGRPLGVGDVVTVLRRDERVAVARVEAIRDGRAEGTITERYSTAPLLPPELAVVAPCAIPVTAADGGVAHLALPADHGLSHGTLLRVLRDGREIGSAALSLAEGLPAQAVPITVGAPALRVGDVCYATFDSAPLPPADAPPSPVAISQPPEPAPSATDPNAILVTGVHGDTVYFWAPTPDALAASTERVTVLRDGECIAVVRLAAEGPLGGTVESARPGLLIAVGDHARPFAEEDSIPGVAVAESPPKPPLVAQAALAAPVSSDTAPRVAALVPDVDKPTTASVPTDTPRKLDASPPLGLSLSGPTGLLRTPNAEVQPSGVVRLGHIFVSPDLDRSFPGSRSRSQFTVGAVPRLELGVAHYARFLEDLTYHAKIQLMPESHRWPALAVGTMDERAAFDLEPTRFLALSKRFVNGRLRGTVGWGDGGLDGAFGGLEAALNPSLTLLAEYDTEDVNFGLRTAPTPRVHIDLADLSGTLGGQVTYAFLMDEEDAPPHPVTLVRPTEPAKPQALANRLKDAICALGMENVRAEMGEGPSGPTAAVFYENRRYLHDDTEALGLVLATATRELPPDTARLAIIVSKSQVPVLRVITQPDDYVRFLSGELASERFANTLQVDHSGESPIPQSRVRGRSGLASPTRLTADLAVTPAVRTLVGTERPTLDDPGATESLAVRFSLRPDLSANVGRGLDLRYSHGIHVAGALGVEIDPLFASDAAYASYLFAPFDGALARIAAGDFLGGRRGGLAEGIVSLSGDRILLRGLAGGLSDRRFFDRDSYHPVYVGDVRYRVPSIDLVASATFGRYIDDDAGFTLGLRKHFEDTELEMQLRHSDFGDVLLLTGTLPIGPRAWPKPDPFRVRLGDRLRFGQRALLPEGGEAGLVSVASMVANQVEDLDLADTFLNRDRLNAAYLKTHLNTLIRAAHHVAGD